jgi:hypothetical protein
MKYKFHDPKLAKAAKIAEACKAVMQQAMGQGTQQSAAQAAAQSINAFLSVAPNKYWAVLGTVAAGSAGGATGNVIWQQQLPIVPSFCVAIDYVVTLPVQVTLGTTSGAATLSPFAPYSAIQNQITLGGAPPWNLTEMTPWYFDSLMHANNYDPNYPGLGNNEGYFATITDQGPNANVIGGAGSLSPGATVTNATGANTVTQYNFQFKVRQQLQRKRHLLWGAIPFGDPENRPYNLTQLSQLSGVNPELNMFVNIGLGANSQTAIVVGAAGVTVNATYELAYIDLLPPSVTAPPQPQIGYGLQLVTFNTTGISPGTINPITHRTAMCYTSIHQLLINGQLPLRADYFGLWDDQDQQSSRWNFDASQNTLHEYFDLWQRRNRRYPLTGLFTTDLESGVFPEVPSVTPYDALMSPDASYAQAFGVPVTPAMTTAIRIPSATVANNPYIKTYSFGLVRVPY